MSLYTQKISPSATLAINAKAKELKAKGIDVISFAVGEPDFDTPEHIKKAAIEKILEGKTKYTPAGGINELKEEIVKKFKKDNNIDYEIDEVLVSSGAKMILYEAIASIVNPNDEVIILKPFWISYPAMVLLAGGVPKFVDCDENFDVNIDDVKDAITKKTKAIIINSPSNPSGKVYGRKFLEDLADIAIKNKIYIISDEIYEKLIYNGKNFSVGSIKDARNLTITVNGFSKSYAMTGWRIGYCGANREIIKEMKKIESHTNSCVPYFTQYAALVALSSDQLCVENMRKKFEERRNYIVKRAREIFDCYNPEGAFYIFPKISKFEKDSKKFSEFLLDNARIGVVPGIEFGLEGHIRISYATSIENIKEGFDRIEKALKNLKWKKSFLLFLLFYLEF